MTDSVSTLGAAHPENTPTCLLGLAYCSVLDVRPATVGLGTSSGL